MGKAGNGKANPEGWHVETMWKTPHKPAENVVAGIAECLRHARRGRFWELKQKVRVEC